MRNSIYSLKQSPGCIGLHTPHDYLCNIGFIRKPSNPCIYNVYYIPRIESEQKLVILAVYVDDIGLVLAAKK